MISDLLFYCWFAICAGIMAFVLHTLGNIGGGDAVVIAFLTVVLFFGGLFIGFSIEEFIKKLQNSKGLQISRRETQ